MLKLSNHGDFTCDYILGLPGFDFYIFILLNKYIKTKAQQLRNPAPSEIAQIWKL